MKEQMPPTICGPPRRAWSAGCPAAWTRPSRRATARVTAQG